MLQKTNLYLSVPVELDGFTESGVLVEARLSLPQAHHRFTQVWQDVDLSGVQLTRLQSLRLTGHVCPVGLEFGVKGVKVDVSHYLVTRGRLVAASTPQAHVVLELRSLGLLFVAVATLTVAWMDVQGNGQVEVDVTRHVRHESRQVVRVEVAAVAGSYRNLPLTGQVESFLVKLAPCHSRQWGGKSRTRQLLPLPSAPLATPETEHLSTALVSLVKSVSRLFLVFFLKNSRGKVFPKNSTNEPEVFQLDSVKNPSLFMGSFG